MEGKNRLPSHIRTDSPTVEIILALSRLMSHYCALVLPIVPIVLISLRLNCLVCLPVKYSLLAFVT